MSKRVSESAKSPAKSERPASVAPISARSKAKKRREYRHAAIKLPTWQNPVVEYWNAYRNKIRTHRQNVPRHVHQERQILAMLAFFSVSIGLWENFRQLWLVDNGFSVTGVSNIISIGMFMSVLGVIIVGRFVKMSRIKIFMAATLICRTAILFALYFLNGTGLPWLIAALSALEVVGGCLIVTSVYPLLTTVMKSNNAYSRRKLVEYLFRDIGVLVGAVIIGRHFSNWIVDYNTCLMVSMIFSIVSAIIMSRFRLTITEHAPKKEHFSAVKYALKRRVHRLYMAHAFLAGCAYNTAIGIRMLVLTDYFDFSAGMATTYLLIVGLLSDLFGILALRYFTPKSDYLSIFIKFGTRIFLFALAFATGNFFICFLSLTWTLFSSTAYENITDGYYINSVDNRHQLKYNTLRYVVAYTGDALGVFLSGQMFQFGPGYIFGMAGLICSIQIVISCLAIRERTKHGFNRR